MDVLHELKDGKYTGEIADITTTDTPSGHHKITWLLRITGGQYDGACVEKNYYLTSDSAIAFLKKELKLIKLFSEKTFFYIIISFVSFVITYLVNIQIKIQSGFINDLISIVIFCSIYLITAVFLNPKEISLLRLHYKNLVSK